MNKILKLLLLSLLVLSIGIVNPGITDAYAATVQQYELWWICIAVSGILAKLVCGPEPVVDPIGL